MREIVVVVVQGKGEERQNEAQNVMTVGSQKTYVKKLTSDEITLFVSQLACAYLIHEVDR